MIFVTCEEKSKLAFTQLRDADPTISGVALASGPTNRLALFTARRQIAEAVFSCKAENSLINFNLGFIPG